ncbi:MAG: alkaline shock response membrane anchor protein AmaP [Candidatus Omnitrophota bacterium]|nr:alkaline shock response membrane anchor protein AmaP [Candidatus Omnitrophota bacterium]
MRFISGLTLFFYTIVFLLIGALFIIIALNIIPQEFITEVLYTTYSSTNTRLALGITGILLMFISIMVAQIAMGKLQREKTIAFENPDGQVTISLSAIEDFIKRALKQLPEVKELRPSVRAGKKGIAIINRVTLFSDVNIPETTEKIQNIVKSRVQDMLGVEEPINIKVHVVKIAHKEETAKDVKKEDKPPQFRGSIEYGSF